MSENEGSRFVKNNYFEGVSHERVRVWSEKNAGGSCGAQHLSFKGKTQFEPAWRMSVRTRQAEGRRFLHQKGGGASRRAAAFGSRHLSAGGISALRLLWLVRSVHSCGMLAKIFFFLKTKLLCPAAASGGFVRSKNWPRMEVCQTS